MNTKEYIIDQFKKYPHLEFEDLMKFLYQSSFGCEHLVSDYSIVKKRIQQEFDTQMDSCNSIEYLDGDYVRLHLNYGLSVNTLSTLFILSSQQEKNGIEQLENKLQTLLDLIQDNTLPFSLELSKDILLKWKKEGYPAIHHSNTFNQLYHPSYRLIHKRYVPYLPLFKCIDNNHPSMISMDGRCASGKTTLAKLLQQVYDCNVFKMDDFFLQPYQRTKERLESPGENIDHERFEEEILIPLSKQKDVSLRKFNCSTMSIEPSILIPYKPLNIIEGSYSMHSSLQKYYDSSVFLTINKEEQLSRLKKRNPSMLNNFIQRWIPLEEMYFNTFSIQDKCDMKIDTSKA